MMPPGYVLAPVGGSELSAKALGVEEAEKVANLDRFEGQYVKDGIIKGYSDNTN